MGDAAQMNIKAREDKDKNTIANLLYAGVKYVQTGQNQVHFHYNANYINEVEASSENSE